MKDLLFKFLKPYRKEILLALLILPLGSLSFSIQPFLLQKAIDGPLASKNHGEFLLYVAAIAIIVIINFSAFIMQFYLMNTNGQKIVADLRLALFSHIERLPMKYFDHNAIGKIVSRITSDIEQLGESFSGGVILIILDFFNILGVLAFMLYMNWKLFLLIFAFMIPALFITNHYQEMFAQANLSARNLIAKLNSFLQQNIIGINVVQTLNVEEKNSKIFAEYNNEYFKSNEKSIASDAELSAWLETLSLITIVALISLAAVLSYKSLNIKDDLSIGIIIAFIQYTQNLFEPIRNMSDKFTTIQSARTSIQRIEEILEEQPVHDSKNNLFNELQNSLQSSSSLPLIEFRNVYFRYNSTNNSPWVLENLSFSVFQGEKLLIQAPTGVGKTTVIKLLLRLYEIDSGDIFILGHNIQDLSLATLRALITVIHQDTYIFAASLKDNILLGEEHELKEIQELLELVPNLSLDTELSQRALNISAGEEQLINIMRAALKNSPILILDEVSSKIDFETEMKIHNYFSKLFDQRTVIMIAHRDSTKHLASRILDLKNARISNNV